MYICATVFGVLPTVRMTIKRRMTIKMLWFSVSMRWLATNNEVIFRCSDGSLICISRFCFALDSILSLCPLELRKSAFACEAVYMCLKKTGRVEIKLSVDQGWCDE